MKSENKKMNEMTVELKKFKERIKDRIRELAMSGPMPFTQIRTQILEHFGAVPYSVTVAGLILELIISDDLLLWTNQ